MFIMNGKPSDDDDVLQRVFILCKLGLRPLSFAVVELTQADGEDRNRFNVVTQIEGVLSFKFLVGTDLCRQLMTVPDVKDHARVRYIIYIIGLGVLVLRVFVNVEY